ncbi:MAG: MFS transporter [Chloroflexota bacterium]
MTRTAVAARMRRSQGLRAFHHRNYRLFFGGQAVSLVGTWMMTVAQSWLVLQLTGDPFMLGVVAAAQFLPVLLLGLFGGIIADGLPKRRTLMVTQAIAAGLSLLLFVLAATGTVQVWQIVVIAAIGGVRNAFDLPTRQAFAVELVGREDIANAVAMNSALFNGARVVGPAVAGVLIGISGVAAAFLIDGLSFLAVLVGLALMRESELLSPPRTGRPATARAALRQIGEGLHHVRRTPLVLLAITVVGVVSTFGMNFTVLAPALAQDVLHTDASGYGFLMAASGVGSLLTALVIAFRGGTSPRVMAAGALVLGLAEVVLGATGFLSVALAAMLAVGIGTILMAATANTVIQLSVPDTLRGRVMSVYTTVFAGSTPVGGLVMGWIAAQAGVASAFLVGGVICAVMGVGAFAWVRRLSVGDLSALAASGRSGSVVHPTPRPAEARSR